MRAMPVFSVLLVSAGLLAAAPASAEVTCNDITFTGPVAAEFPTARDFCLGVAERDGEPYAHFVGEVDRVRGGTVYMKFKKASGGYGKTVSFTPPSDFRAKIDGRSYSVRSLERGQELDVWLPNNRWEIAQQDTPEEFVAASSVAMYAIEEPEAGESEYQAAAMLPRTASPWPAVGLAGASLLGLAGLVALWRRRLSA